MNLRQEEKSIKKPIVYEMGRFHVCQRNIWSVSFPNMFYFLCVEKLMIIVSILGIHLLTKRRTGTGTGLGPERVPFPVCYPEQRNCVTVSEHV